MNSNLRIPSVFHRIWLGTAKMPQEFEAFADSWRRMHPGWQMKTWTDDELPALRNRWAFDVAPAMSARSNIFRYELLLDHGGVYIDTDFECVKNLEPLLEGVDCFVGLAEEGQANNAIIGAVPGHPFLHDLVVSLEDNVRRMPYADASVVQSGPFYLTTVLARHPEVTVFPPEFFYPYAWHERWRRHERFPEAYGVHHWSLTWRASKWPERRTLGSGSEPCLSVVILATGDTKRLQWTLEGLAVQTVTDFEVIIVSHKDEEVVAPLAMAFSDRLNIRCEYHRANCQQARSAAAYNRGLRLARGPRLLFLGDDCLPDVDVVETHAVFADRELMPFGFHRSYPASKFYPFRPPVDYDGIKWHAGDDPRLGQALHGDWRDVNAADGGCCCVSMPRAAVLAADGFDVTAEGSPLSDLTRRMSAQMYRLVPLWDRGWVTRFERDSRTTSRVGQRAW